MTLSILPGMALAFFLIFARVGAMLMLMPPYHVTQFDSDGVTLTVQFSRFHVGGNSAVHGGVLPLMFASTFGMVIHATGRPISRTGFLHVDYRKVTPIDTTLLMRGWVRETEGRKAFVNAELRDPDDNGVELYWDRPPEQWPRTPGGELAMFTGCSISTAC